MVESRQPTEEEMRDEMTCDCCGRQHGVVWFAPSDIWNRTMRDGDRGNADRYPFCCPICFMRLAEEAGVETTGWLVTPEEEWLAQRDELREAEAAAAHWLDTATALETELVAQRDVVAARNGWVEHICGHSHRWCSEDKSTRCPVCGTTTFKEAKSAD